MRAIGRQSSGATLGAMTDAKVPPAPKDSGPAGRKLWRSVAGEWDLDVHEQLLLTEACRTADRLADMADLLATAPMTVENRFGELTAHPLLVESRQQSIVLARLLAALRLPEGDEGDMRRPQRRSARGFY